MAIARDATSSSNRTGTTDPHTWTHTGRASGSGGIQGVVVIAMNYSTGTDQVTSVSYGGVSLTEVAAGGASDAAGEPTQTQMWWVGSGLSGVSGSQTVSVDLASATGDDIFFVCVTLTSAGTVDIVDSDKVQADASNPTVTLQNPSGYACLIIQAIASGVAAEADSAPSFPGLAFTTVSQDTGQEIQRVDIANDTRSSTSLNITYAQASDDVSMVTAIFREVSGPTTHSGSASFSSDGSMTATGLRTAKASASFSSDGAMTATGTYKALASASFSSDGEMTADASVTGLATAYPSVVARASNTKSANTTSFDVTLPSGIQRGDLIAVIIGCDGSPTMTTPASGFSVIGTGRWLAASSAATMFAYGKTADGTESSTTVTFTLSASEQGAIHAIIVRDWGGTVADIFGATAVTGTSDTGNSGNANHPNYGSVDWLAMTAVAWDLGGSTLVSSPANYATDELYQSPGTTGGASLYTGYRQVNAGSVDPGNVVQSASEEWVALTFLIPPEVELFNEDYEGRGTSPSAGTAMSSSNTDWDLFNGTGTRTFESATPPAKSGSFRGDYSIGASNQALTKDNTSLPGPVNGGTAQKLIRCRFYIRTTSLPSIVNRFAVFEEAAAGGGDDIVALNMQTDGTVRMVNQTTVSGSGSSHQVGSHTHYHRIEWLIDIANGYQEVQMWWGADVDSVDTGATNYETWNYTAPTSADPMEVFGVGMYAGASSMVGIDSFVVRTGASLAGPDVIAATTHNGVANFSSDGSMSASAIVTKVASASFSSDGAMTATAVVKKVASASFSSDGSMTATGSRTAVASASFSSDGSMTAVGLYKAFATAAFSSDGSMTAVGVYRALALASFSSDGAMTATGVVKKLASASFSAEASFSGAIDNATESEMFEVGSDGDSIGNTYDLFDDGLDTGTGSWEVDDLRSAVGSKSGWMSLSIGDSSYRWMYVSGGDKTILQVRWYMYAEAPSGITGTAVHFCRATRTGGAAVGRVSMNSSETLGLHDGTTGGSTGDVDFDAQSLWSKWIRYEWEIDTVADTQELNMFVGANMHGSVPDYTITHTISDTVGTGRLEFGSTLTVGAPLDVWWDAIGYLSGTTPIGAASTGGPVGLVKKGASASFSAESSLTATGLHKAVASASFSAESSLTATGIYKAFASASFSSDGAMTATGVVKKIASAAFSSDGAMTASAIVKKVASASFSSDSSMSAAGNVIKVASASFSSDGSMTATGAIKVVATVSFSADGSMTATGSRTAEGIASFSAESSMTINGLYKAFGVASFSSDGSMTAVGIYKAFASASFASDGAMTASATLTRYGTASFSSESSMTAVGTYKALATASFSSDGSMTVAGTVKKLASASFSSDGSMTATGLRYAEAIATFSSASSMIAVGTYKALATASFVSDGVMSVAGTVTKTASASFSSVSSMTATGSRIAEGIATFSSDGAMTATGLLTAKASAAFSSASSMTATGSRTAEGIAAFSSDGSMTATGSHTAEAVAIFASDSSMTAVGTYKALATASFSSDSSMTADGTVTKLASASFSADGSMTADGSVSSSNSIHFSAASSMTASGTVTNLASASFSSDSDMTALGTVTKVASAAFSSESNMTATGSLKAVASASFSADSSMTATGSVTVEAVANFSAESNLSVDGVGTVSGVASFSAIGSLDAVGTYKALAAASLSADSSITAIGTYKAVASTAFVADSSMTVAGTVTKLASVAFSGDSAMTGSGTVRKLASVSLSSNSSMLSSGTIKKMAVASFSGNSTMTADGLVINASIGYFGIPIG